MSERLSERGATVIEAAIVLPVLLALLIVTVDVLVHMHQMLSLQYVLTAETRRILVGHYATTAELDTAIRQRLDTFGVGLGGQDKLTLCPTTTYKTTSCPENTLQLPAAGQLMVLNVVKEANAFMMLPGALLGSGALDLQATVVARREPE